MFVEEVGRSIVIADSANRRAGRIFDLENQPFMSNIPFAALVLTRILAASEVQAAPLPLQGAGTILTETPMLLAIGNTPEFADDWFAAIATTLKLIAVSTSIAALLGIPAAFCVSLLRPKHPLVRLWALVSLTSSVMPLILLAAAWEATAGKFGWLITTMTGGNLWWVGWIHGMHGAAMVGLATAWGTRRISSVAIQQAALDFSPAGTWWRVRFPIALPWITAAMIGVMVLASTEMSVADLHSVRTVADQFYLFYSVDPDTTSVLVSTLIPMVLGGVPALLWFALYRRRWKVAAETSAHSQQPPLTPNNSTTSPMRLVATAGVLLSTLLLLLPLVGLVIQTGHSVEVVDGQRQATFQWSASLRAISEAPGLFREEIVWTIQLALFSILLTVPVAFAFARCARSFPRVGVLFDALGTMLFLVPGPVIGMTVAALFRLQLSGLDRLATHTLIPTLLAVGVRSTLVAYAILRNGYDAIDEPSWLAGRMDGSIAWRFWNLERPRLIGPLAVASLAVAIVSAGDVPAAMPVLPPGVTTTGTRLFGLLHSGARYQEASLAMTHIAMVLGLCGLMLGVQLHLRGRSKDVD